MAATMMAMMILCVPVRTEASTTRVYADDACVISTDDSSFAAWQDGNAICYVINVINEGGGATRVLRYRLKSYHGGGVYRSINGGEYAAVQCQQDWAIFRHCCDLND